MKPPWFSRCIYLVPFGLRPPDIAYDTLMSEYCQALMSEFVSMHKHS